MTPEFHAICEHYGMRGRAGCRVRPIIGLILIGQRYGFPTAYASDLNCGGVTQADFAEAHRIIAEYRELKRCAA